MTDQVTPTPEPTQEEKDAALAQKYRDQLGGTPPAGDDGKVEKGGEKPQRPEHIPEKFWDAEKGEVRVEELAKSYAELEKKGATPPAKPDVKPQGIENPGEGVTDTGLLEFQQLREKVTEKLVNGEELDETDYAGFAKRGLDKADVDAFIAGQQALGQLATMKVHSEAGGKEQYETMISWAKTAFTKEEIEAYNRDIHSMDSAVSLNAVRGLKARFAVANGVSGRNVTEKGSTPGGTNPFKSKAEMVAAMQDPKYRKDEAYRAEVAKRVKASMDAGVSLQV